MDGTPHRRSTHLLVVGSVAVDRLERAGRVEHRLGGVAAYGGLTAARLGCSIDAWSALSREWIATARALLSPISLQIAESPTSTYFVNCERLGDERVQRCPSRAWPLRAIEFPFVRGESWDWIHLGPLHPDDIRGDVIDALRSRCRWMSLDIQGYTRRVHDDGAVTATVTADLADRLAGLDWIKASEAEWQLVADHLRTAPMEALRRFGWRGLLVSAGARGGILHTANGATPWKAARAKRVLLETGAGDVFTAAFLSKMVELRQIARAAPAHDPSLEALAFAADIAARHVAGDWLDLDALRILDR